MSAHHQPQLEFKFPEAKTVDELLLDPKNPRLDIGPNPSQDILLKELARGFDLLELGESFVAHGYFSEEPLVVIPQDNECVVLEGNRRLAALKLLLHPQKAVELKVPQARKWEELAAENKQNLTQVPVITYQTREEVVPFLGFRHITGVKKWDPLAKARFISQHVEQQKDWKTVAKLINSKTPQVRDNYIAYRMVEQAKNTFGIDTEKVEEDFSVLFRALSETGIREHFGVDPNKPVQEQQEPIPPERSEQTRELLDMMFGTEGSLPVLRESRDLHKLSEILRNPISLERLRTRGDIDEAYLYAGGEESEVQENLRKASVLLEQANGKIHRHVDSLEIRKLVKDCNDTIKRIIGAFPEKDLF
ncbi:MAG: hypothetical protein GC165_06320 [Armatimonadetes bacterium]|nr:hypothetical protein [Armatimonadota bacterium]